MSVIHAHEKARCNMGQNTIGPHTIGPLHMAHNLTKARDAVTNMHNAQIQWEDGLITDAEVINKIDKIMLDHLRDKGIISGR